MVLIDQRRVDARGDAGLAVLHHREQLDHLVFGGGRGDVVRGDLGDALHGHVVDADVGVEAERGHDGGLVRRVMSLDVAGRIRLGVPLGLRVLERHIEVEALGGHLVEDVVGGAVDDAEHAGDLVADQRFAQRAHDRDRAADRGFEVDVHALGFRGLVDLGAVLGQQRLVGGHHGRAGFDGGQHEGARRFESADQFDDDVGVRGHGHGVAGQQRPVDPGEVDLVRIQAGHADEFDVPADALGEFVPLFHQQTRGLRSDGARAQQSDADGGFIMLCHECPSLAMTGVYCHPTERRRFTGHASHTSAARARMRTGRRGYGMNRRYGKQPMARETQPAVQLTSSASRSSTVCRRSITCAPEADTAATAGINAWL